jgi:hypothetical protein
VLTSYPDRFQTASMGSYVLIVASLAQSPLWSEHFLSRGRLAENAESRLTLTRNKKQSRCLPQLTLLMNVGGVPLSRAWHY